MLTDIEIVEVNKDEKYEQVFKKSFSGILKDLVSSGGMTLKPNVSILSKIGFGIAKSWYVKSELSKSSKNLLENLINYELLWDRIPKSVELICESENDFIWMRFDEVRVDALFKQSIFLMKDSTYRSVVKQYSNIHHEKNSRLKELLLELQILHKASISYVRRRGLFKGFIQEGADLFYDKHGDKMIEGYINNTLKSGGKSLINPPNKDITDEGE